MIKMHLERLKVRHYRGFQDVALENLLPVNIIGGENGIGKSSLLDAIFHLYDGAAPNTLFRPFDWRFLSLGPTDNLLALRQVFFQRDATKAIEVRGETNRGTYTLTITGGVQRLGGHITGVSNPTEPGQASGATTGPSFSGEGYAQILKHSGKSIVDFAVVVNSGNIQFELRNQSVDDPILTCYTINSATRRTSPDMADRFSKIVAGGHQPKLMEFLQVVHPEVQGLQLLTWAGVSVIHADIGNGNWIPLPFLGEGAVSLACVFIAMASAQGGVVLLDEVDAAIHHSHVDKFWNLIFRSTRDFECQVFATTHSENSLEAAAHAAANLQCLSRLHYSRLRRAKSGAIKAVSYTGAELSSAIAGDWEVR